MGPNIRVFLAFAGLGSNADGLDTTSPGFGPFGTSGAHAFNQNSAAFIRIAALNNVRSSYLSLRYGRQYQRAISNFRGPFALPNAGEFDRLVPHSRR